MADQADVRRIALALPEVEEAAGEFAFRVGGKLVAWTWLERTAARQPRVPRPDVLALRVANLREKQALLAADPEKFFTEPHYNGFPAVLVRLPAIEVDELEELLTDAWRTQAPKALVRDFGAGRGGSA
jgi:hypothetical protein